MKDKEFGLIEEMLPILVSDGAGNFTESQKEAARKFTKFVDHLPGGFLIYRANATEEIIYANKALIRMFGCREIKEFYKYTGKSFKGIVYRDDYDDVSKSINQQISSNNDNFDYVEYRILTKSGTIRCVDDYGHFLHTKVGDIFYVFITDVTDRKAKLQQEQLQRLEVIEGLSLNYDTILYVDLDSDAVIPYRMSPRLKTQFEGRVQARNYGSVTEDYVVTWIHPEDQQRIREILSADYIRNNLQDKRSFFAVFKCLQGGEIQHLELRVVDVKNNGYISQIVIGVRNVEEERKQSIQQRALLENALKEAKNANVAKNTFLSNVSHDMHTPLNAIFGYIELAKKSLNDRAGLEKAIEKINTASTQLLDLVDKVLDITYLESKDFQLKEEACDLRDLILTIHDEVLPEANKKEINLILDHSGVTNSQVLTDVEKLKLVLENIASNAIKYTSKGGKVEIVINETPSTSDEYAFIHFIIKDTGIGIAKESLDKIFEPFEREQNYTQSGVYGTGLGLAIAKQIVESMGGTIVAESQMGVGSTFTVTVNFKLAHKKEEASNTDDVEEFIKDKKILLVEDNEINLEMETILLEDLGLIIEPAENGLIAVEKMKIAKPGEYLFVLMDIQMPVMDGWQATEGIRALPEPEIANIPIIALSANALDSDKRMSAKNGMNAHLKKPMNIPVLLGEIKRTVMKK